ncbi:MAG: NUDIX hydrolase [Clostridia bacterium]|nr:NUDIX hydrolase [Clostridia bacterium]
MNKLISEETLFNGPRFNLKRRIYENVEGKEYIRDYVDTQSASIIIALTSDKKVVFIRQQREISGLEDLELPAGVIDEGEDAITAARRELQEETGYYANNIEYMGDYFASCGYSNEKLYFYLATDLEMRETHYDSDEVITGIQEIPIEECYEMVRNNQFPYANINLGILLYQLKYEK